LGEPALTGVDSLAIVLGKTTPDAVRFANL
jgi:hypothetical protein